MQEAKTSKAYGEQNRIIIPHTFKHEMGIPSIDRKTEILMKVRVVMVCVWCVWCVCVCARARVVTCTCSHAHQHLTLVRTYTYVQTRVHTHRRESSQRILHVQLSQRLRISSTLQPPPRRQSSRSVST